MIDEEFQHELLKYDSTQLAKSSEYRRQATKYNPRLFAFIYLRHHITDDYGNITFSSMHREWYEYALDWINPNPNRSAYVAPRNSAKSTMWFTIIPLWAAAHGHKKFITAFASTPTQAQVHLSTFKSELENNDLLKVDFPQLCTPAKRESGTVVSDRQSMTQRQSGFIFAAAGVDSSVAGLKVGNMRPDVLVFDDIEPHEANYSTELAKKREATILGNLFFLNTNAKIIMVGTVTMEGSIIHQLVQSVTTGEKSQFVLDSGVKTHYYPALIIDPDGSQRSLWEARWSLDYLIGESHKRSFQLNMQNLPVALDGEMFYEDAFKYQELPEYPRTIISVDPAVTVSDKSDFTGISVVSYDPKTKKMFVRECIQVKLQPAQLKSKVAELLELHPEVGVLLVETNQGGGTWAPIFEGLPVKYREVKQNIKKTVRAKLLLTGMEKGSVLFERPMPQLMNQMLLFPNGMHDDMVDSVSSAYGYFFNPNAGKRVKPGISQHSYV